jgi:predicted RecB family nuclease
MHRLSKSRFLAGLQCHKRLWWESHEPYAEELRPEPEARLRMEEGLRVGHVARDYVKGGVLVGSFYDTVDARLAATRRAIDSGESVIYEANALADQVLVQADILRRESRECFTLIEVKASTAVKDEHFPDVAIQSHVLRRAGVPVNRMEVMHLNRECRHPDLSTLFVRQDITARVETLLPAVPDLIAAQIAALDGPLPQVRVGPHCTQPRDCPFIERCWAAVPPDHVTRLYGITAQRKAQLEQHGWTTIGSLPEDIELPPATRRQIRALRSGALVLDPGLADRLDTLEGPLAFLDFETINPAIPVWPGCRPYDIIPVQFSCHVEQPDGSLRHFAHLVDRPGDPRPEIAHRLVTACHGARAVLVYNVNFERQGVRRLAEAVPALAAELDDLESRLVDLLPMVRDHVYHPEFDGNFSLKAVMPALEPGFGYDDLDIKDGATASLELARLILDTETVDETERSEKRDRLLRYCERDTLALVRLLEALRDLAGPPRVQLELF